MSPIAGGMPSRAIVVMEVPGTGIIMGAIHAETLELSADPGPVNDTGYYPEYKPGTRWEHLMIQGRLVQALRVWPTWEDFYSDMGVRPPSRLGGPDRLPEDPDRDELEDRTPIALPGPRGDGEE